MKLLNKSTYLTAGVCLALTLGATDCFAIQELMQPFQEKATEVTNMIKTGFGFLAGIVLSIQIVRGVLSKDPQKKQEMFMSAAWIAGGTVALYQLATLLQWMGVPI